MKFLIVEDETKISDEISASLRQEGHKVICVDDGLKAIEAAIVEEPDAIVLDIGLPKLNGISVLKQIRSEGFNIPIIILSARGNWTDKVEGIDSGADDYMAKPFAMEELKSRLYSIIRRKEGISTSKISINNGKVIIDTRQRSVVVEGKSVDLTSLEFKFITYLIMSKNKVISQSEIFEHVYDEGKEPDSNAIEVLVGRIRKKIGSDIILTRRGQGYIIEQ